MSVALRAEPSPTISTINLAITIASFLTTLPTLLPRPFPRRLIRFLRLLHCALLLSPLVLSLLTLSDFLRRPVGSVCTVAAAERVQRILARAAARFDATPGITRFVLPPDAAYPDPFVAPHVAIVCAAVLAAGGIVFRRAAVRRRASIIAFAVSTVYVLGALLAAFQPGKLDRDSSILRESWLDQRFKEIDGVNETRFLSNVWLGTGEMGDVDEGVRKRNATNALEVEGFHDAFCETFNQLPIEAGLVVDVVDENGIPVTSPPLTVAASTTTATTTTSIATTTITVTEGGEGDGEDSEEDDRPQARQAIPRTRQSSDELLITRNLLSQLLIVYTIGKPLFTTYGKSLSLLSLPFLTLTPVVVAHATRSSVLYPFVAAWVCLLLLLIVYATPETLRWVGVGFESSDLMTFCGRRYQVFVTDDVSYRIGVFDMVSFGLIVVTGVLQGFRWMRVREQQKENEGEVKMMAYDEVYSENGALRW